MNKMIDYAFIRLKKTFAEAREMDDPKQATRPYFNSIFGTPYESYLAITNSDVDIIFDNDFRVEVIDCKEKVLYDITEFTEIRQFSNSVTGIKNIAFEIFKFPEYVGVSYLKFTHTTGSEKFYSNPIYITSEESELRSTLRLVYKSYGYFSGVDYKNSNYFQTIRLKGTLLSPSDPRESKTYITYSGSEYSFNPVLQYQKNVIFEDMTELSFLALDAAISNDIVYIDGYRVTNKPQLKSGEMQGQSNTFDVTATLAIDKNQKFIDEPQLWIKFAILSLFPKGAINSSGLTESPIAVFNRNVTLDPYGKLYLYKENGELVGSYDIMIYGTNGFTTNEILSDMVSENGSYYFNILFGSVKSIYNENIAISDNTTWKFTIGEGDFINTDWDSNDFLTN